MGRNKAKVLKQKALKDSKFKKRKGKTFIDRKQAKQNLKEKRARLVIKNLSFKATEAKIKEHFKQYGEVVNVDLLKKPDGKLVGCAFVQFRLVQFAKQAQHYTNNQPFLGRNIIVDFSKPKDKYNKEKVKKERETEIKKEENETNVVEIKDEDDSDNKHNSLEESMSDTDVSDQELDESDLDNEPLDTCSQSSDPNKKKTFMSHDVAEGKTVFIKNVPFQATNGDVKACMAQFGPLYYALVCVDKFTEHSKGTAFVKFVNKEDAEKALKAGTELTLLGNILDCNPALERNDVKHKVQAEKEQKNKSRDARNLYLVKEGVILAGTKAAEGVSASDMAKRLQIEQYKTQMLRNLNTFVAQDRLVVHNLPATWDDKKLRMLFERHGGKGAVVREARVMRDMRKLDANGVGTSKQYGFVAFTKHENALAALRALNNNPDIFSPQKRPIITFSIENKSALKAKIKRQEKSRLKNPKSKNYDPALVKKIEDTNMDIESEAKPYSGIAARKGSIQKMRSRYKLNTQAKLHQENIRKEKRKQKMSKKSLEQKKKDFIKQPKQKINNKRNKDDDNFSRMVNDYKKKLLVDTNVKKMKWYE